MRAPKPKFAPVALLFILLCLTKVSTIFIDSRTHRICPFSKVSPTFEKCMSTTESLLKLIREGDMQDLQGQSSLDSVGKHLSGYHRRDLGRQLASICLRRLCTKATDTCASRCLKLVARRGFARPASGCCRAGYCIRIWQLHLFRVLDSKAPELFLNLKGPEGRPGPFGLRAESLGKCRGLFALRRRKVFVALQFEGLRTSSRAKLWGPEATPGAKPKPTN